MNTKMLKRGAIETQSAKKMVLMETLEMMTSTYFKEYEDVQSFASRVIPSNNDTVSKLLLFYLRGGVISLSDEDTKTEISKFGEVDDVFISKYVFPTFDYAKFMQDLFNFLNIPYTVGDKPWYIIHYYFFYLEGDKNTCLKNINDFLGIPEGLPEEMSFICLFLYLNQDAYVYGRIPEFNIEGSISKFCQFFNQPSLVGNMLEVYHSPYSHIFNRDEDQEMIDYLFFSTGKVFKFRNRDEIRKHFVLFQEGVYSLDKLDLNREIELLKNRICMVKGISEDTPVQMLLDDLNQKENTTLDNILVLYNIPALTNGNIELKITYATLCYIYLVEYTLFIQTRIDWLVQVSRNEYRNDMKSFMDEVCKAHFQGKNLYEAIKYQNKNNTVFDYSEVLVFLRDFANQKHAILQIKQPDQDIKQSKQDELDRINKSTTLYEVLGLTEEESLDPTKISQEFKRLALLFHTDKNPNDPDGIFKDAFNKIEWAKTQLLNPNPQNFEKNNSANGKFTKEQTAAREKRKNEKKQQPTPTEPHVDKTPRKKKTPTPVPATPIDEEEMEENRQEQLSVTEKHMVAGGLFADEYNDSMLKEIGYNVGDNIDDKLREYQVLVMGRLADLTGEDMPTLGGNSTRAILIILIDTVFKRCSEEEYVDHDSDSVRDQMSEIISHDGVNMNSLIDFYEKLNSTKLEFRFEKVMGFCLSPLELNKLKTSVEPLSVTLSKIMDSVTYPLEKSSYRDLYNDKSGNIRKLRQEQKKTEDAANLMGGRQVVIACKLLLQAYDEEFPCISKNPDRLFGSSWFKQVYIELNDELPKQIKIEFEDLNPENQRKIWSSTSRRWAEIIAQ